MKEIGQIMEIIKNRMKDIRQDKYKKMKYNQNIGKVMKDIINVIL